MNELLDNHMGKLVAVAAGTITLCFLWALHADGVRERQKKAEFMAACEADHKHYECMVLWGQASAGSNVSSEAATAFAVGTAIGLSAGRK